MLWTVNQVITSQVLRLVIMVVLLCLLLPKDFVLVGMIAIFTSILSAWVESGNSKAKVQKRVLEIAITEKYFYSFVL